MSSVLADLAAAYTALPAEWLLIGHCLLVSSWFRSYKDRFLLCYWVRLSSDQFFSHLTCSDHVYALLADRTVCSIWRWNSVLSAAARSYPGAYSAFLQQLPGLGVDRMLVAYELLPL